MCFKIIYAREREENIARQRSPITREMFAALLNLAKKSTVDSIEDVIAD
jgi:N-acyl-L-homoserine lactone synthetase